MKHAVKKSTASTRHHLIRRKTIGFRVNTRPGLFLADICAACDEFAKERGTYAYQPT